ncbi:coiled-coil domain-containing protein 14 isoform X2 [Hemicordylus capensis]|uniref:coiled-coil domain-containing protein 14 isoform X2 n=1 Tax=Hemicordylus capensis TaxID=884348 RepID=UPI002304301E|nr:coiled-coil domain-containing protein 14 isoform X2 [Hemicordylus capensis]
MLGTQPIMLGLPPSTSKKNPSQVATIHNGLDRCAALLNDILQNDNEEMETVCRKPGKAAIVRTTSRPLLSKVNGPKKRGPKKNTISAQKEIVPVPNRKPALVNVPSAVKDKASVSTEQASCVQPICVPCTQHSSVMQQKLCEHVQTQMSLINSQPPQKSSGIPDVPFCIIPENVAAYQPSTTFNCRLPTSTPALSPQQAANPSVIQPVVPIENCNQCASQMGPVLLPAGSTASVAQVQPTIVCPALSHMLQSAPNNPMASTGLPPLESRETVSDQGRHEQQLKEADLIRCIQAHLALLQAHEKESGKMNEQYQDVDPIQPKSLSSKEEETAVEHSKGSLSEEEDLDGVDMAPVRDTSCQTSFDKVVQTKKTSLQKTAQKVTTVKYLLGELKALVTDHDDSEILRLLGEVEDCISLLPAAVGSTTVQAEIALALQPLRSENAQLRRRLRILNQQLKEQERAKKECRPDCNFELVSLQSLNITLQSQLNESMKSIELLQNKNEELIKILECHKDENKRLTSTIHEREQELLENRQQYDIDSTKLKIEADEIVTNMKSFQYKLQAAEKENQILSITLRQRDAEVNRLRELTRALQGSMSKLLSDLTMDTAKPKQEKSLSKALLEIHEKQLQPDLIHPLSACVMSYLKKLETDPVVINSEHLSMGEGKESNQVYDKTTAEQTPPKSPVMVGDIVDPTSMFTLLQPDVEGASDSSTLIEGHKPDETIYIPLTSGQSNKPAAEWRTGTQHQVSKRLDHDFRLADSKQPDRVGIRSDAKFSNKFCGSYSPKTVENKSEAMRSAKLENEKLHIQPKEITNGAAKEILDNPDRLQPDKFFYAPILHQKGNGQKKAPGISTPDSSFSTFDRMSGKSEWTISSFSTFTSQDEEDFKTGLAALDANIARLQRTLQNNLKITKNP